MSISKKERDGWIDEVRGALVERPDSVSILDFRRIAVDHTRHNGRRPAIVTLAVHDDVVKALKGDDEKASMDVYLVAVGRKATR